jgi:hypothetical protein
MAEVQDEVCRSAEMVVQPAPRMAPGRQIFPAPVVKAEVNHEPSAILFGDMSLVSEAGKPLSENYLQGRRAAAGDPMLYENESLGLPLRSTTFWFLFPAATLSPDTPPGRYRLQVAVGYVEGNESTLCKVITSQVIDIQPEYFRPIKPSKLKAHI